jgi:hypothetical protein
MASTSAPKRGRSESVTAIVHFDNVAVTLSDADDKLNPAVTICRRLMGGKERVTRSFFAMEGFDRADALAPQLQSVWVALYQGNGVLLSGSIGFTFAGEGPLPERSDLEVGFRELPDNTMLYVLEWVEEVALGQCISEDDWLLFDGGSIAEEYKVLKARHYRWFEEASYEAEVPYLDQMMRAKADEAWTAVEGSVAMFCEASE